MIERAEARPEDTAYIILDDHGEEAQRLTYARLLAGAAEVAHAVARHGAQARIVIALPTSVEFCLTFYGCLLAGSVAVPIPVPNVHRFEAVLRIVSGCEASCIVTLPSLLAGLRQALDEAGMAWVNVMTYDALIAGIAAPYRMPSANQVALLQYTSGSTAAPKGVIVTHGNIIANEVMIQAAFRHSAATTVVGWAPLHHDQGLIGNMIQPLFAGCRCVLMAPMTFLRAPHLWLQAISRYAAHTSGGPNFCYDLCVSRVSDDRCHGLDLSSWQLAFNGAEPISASTLRRFADKFEPYGFRFESFFLCYGLAEASLYVSGAHAAASMRALVDADDAPVHGGVPHPDMSLLLRPASSAAQEQEICIAGPNVTSGYWGSQGGDLFFEADGKSYLRTGDTGYLKDGYLYVTGRAKEVLIIRGRNVYPYDIERTVTATHEAFLPGACAVIAIGAQENQEIVAVQEVERTARHALDYDTIAASVRRNVVRQHDVLIKRVVFAKPGFIPKTTSGKVKRAQLAIGLPDIADANPKIIATA
ncbi:hypothetical protein CF70_032575 [Cupriavidus sp. SK-3]|nr:hypothetical protein CF70_032575 [Cupriavidus sp. SK-3]